MSLNRRERILAAITISVVAFGLLGMNVKKRVELIKSKAATAHELSNRVALQHELIDATPEWTARYERVKNQMPVFEPGRQVDAYWLNIMDMAAEQTGMRIRNRQAKSETVVSDVYEFPIEVRDWEATLDSLLHFMHALQSEGAMLDIRELRVSPVPNRQGYLRGSFTLYCAYMRRASGSAPAQGVERPPTAAQQQLPPAAITGGGLAAPVVTTQEQAE